MYFMNRYEIEDFYATYAYCGNEVKSATALTLNNLMTWADDNSDGWSSWPAPAKAAGQLMRLATSWNRLGVPDNDESRKAYRKACGPIKALRTRRGADFEIVSV